MNSLQQTLRMSQRTTLASPRFALRAVPKTSSSRPFTFTSHRRAELQRAVFSTDSTVDNLERSLGSLITPTGRWSLTQDGAGIERFFQFKSFKAAWTFMNDVANQCRKHKHHPEWSNVYNKVFVRWTTHNPRGLSGSDLTLADACDKFASREETKELEGAADSDGKLGSLADEAAKKGDVEKEQTEKEKEKAKIEKEEGEEGKQGSLAGIGGQPS